MADFSSFQSITTEPPTIQSAADVEPDEQWKNQLKVDIENNLRSMVDEARQNLYDTLKKAPVSAVERERLTEEYLATMKNIRNLAEEQFRIALRRERQERRGAAAGQVLNQDLSGTMIKERQVILDKLEIERKDKAAQSLSSSTDEAQDNIRRASPRSKASLPHRQLPEFWIPSITPEQDAQMSRTFSIACRGSTASTTSSYRAPSVLNIPVSSEQHDMMRSPMERERDHISPVEQEWSSRDKARDGERSTGATATPYRAPSVLNIPPDSPSSTAPIWCTSSRPRAPPASAGRLVTPKKMPTLNYGNVQSSLNPMAWKNSFQGRKAEVTRREQNLPREEARREGEAKTKEEELEEETRLKEAQARKRAENLRKQEEEVARRSDEEEKRVALEILRKSMEAKRKEDEIRRKEEEDTRLKEEAARAKEEETLRRKEEELARREEELLRLEAERIRILAKDKQKVQQEAFRKREEEIRRQRAEEKKRQERFEWESWGYCPPQISRPTPPPPQVSTSQSQSSGSSTRPWSTPTRSKSTSTSRSRATRTPSSRPSSAASSQSSSTPKPPTPSTQPENADAASGPPPPPFSELESIAEFHRRQAEQAQQREEQFRREQAKLEQERLLKAVKAKSVKRDASTIKLFEHHRGQWAKLQMSGMLIWDNFPWPVFKRSSGPSDITTPEIAAYMLSSLHPIDKSPRHRIKENIRRWHHDRFETRLLPKVKESDKDSVREAASTVARTLYHLLRFGMQDPDVSTAISQSSSIVLLEPPILLAQQNTNAPSHPAPTPISEAKAHRSEVEQARQSEERFHLEPLVKLGQDEEFLKEERLTREKECNNLKPHAESLPNISTSPSPEATATEEEASQESPGSVSDSLEDLTNELQRNSSFPAASGGFGDIWKCILVKANENVPVAVKTIRACETDNEELMQKNARRVRRELKVWGRLKHHSILPLWGVANDFGPYPAMICPWADNGALTGFLKRQQDTLSSLDKFSLLNDIALGLQYLHSKSVVHGDLTGSNVLIDGNGRACLADFGLSTIMLEFIGTSYFTSSIRGNVRWVDAELCEASEDDEVSLSPECDIYSFGSITLQVLTCKVPYYNVKKDITVMGQVMKGLKPKPPKESKIAPGHWEFIQRCWLPRTSRPSVAEIVTFVACEQQALSP